MSDAYLLSLIIFAPTIGAIILLAFSNKDEDLMKYVALGFTALTLVLTVLLLGRFNPSEAGIQPVSPEGVHGIVYPWIANWNIEYRLGYDGISLPLVLLTSGVCFLAMMASWNIKQHLKGYLVLFLILETGMLGVFLALDFFLFYVFWEVMLLPMYFLIGIWGGPRKEYAAIKFFLYTLFGGVLMLIAILMLYFSSDLNARELVPRHFANAGFFSVPANADDAAIEQAYKNWLASDDLTAKDLREIKSRPEAEQLPLHTFNILALQQMGQHTQLFKDQILWGKSLEWWAFVLLFIGFIIKVPSVPFHTWLPDAHVEAPPPISMILAGVLLKMGGYGIIRICYPICPEAGYDLAYFVCLVGVVSMVYGAFAAMAQTDFKRLVAYSSVSHMGYVVLGLGVWSAVAGTGYESDYWKMGMNGAMFQMIAHGISSAGMFFMVGVVYDRVHHRNLNEFGGLFAKMPVYSGLAVGIFFAGLGLPGLCGFFGEILVVVSVWNYSMALAVIAASVVILTAGYILWTIQRVYLGAEYKGPHGEALTPITPREFAIAAPILALAIVFGVYPKAVFDYMAPSVNQTVDQLTAWTIEKKPDAMESTAGEAPLAAADQE